jgi:hypothetical protein
MDYYGDFLAETPRYEGDMQPPYPPLPEKLPGSNDPGILAIRERYAERNG